MSDEPKHTTSDDSRDIQLAVHGIAKTWLRHGFCRNCIVREIVTGAAAVANDVAKWPAEEVCDAVNHALSTDIKHIHHHDQQH